MISAFVLLGTSIPAHAEDPRAGAPGRAELGDAQTLGAGQSERESAGAPMDAADLAIPPARELPAGGETSAADSGRANAAARVSSLPAPDPVVRGARAKSRAGSNEALSSRAASSPKTRVASAADSAARGEAAATHEKISAAADRSTSAVAAGKGAPTGAEKQAPPVAPTDARCDMRSPLHEHEVGKGENLGAIAGRYGVMIKDILALNPSIADENKIRVGQKIAVCPELAPHALQRIEVEVAPGETLSHIALRYGMTVDEILGAQGGTLTDPNRVRAGTKLVLMVNGPALPGFRSEEELEVEAPPKPRSGGSHRLRRMPEGAGWELKRPDLAFGTETTIGSLSTAITHYRKRAGKGTPRVHIGDISREGGGPLQPHLSHRYGVDVDIGLVMKGALADRPDFRVAVSNPADIDVHRTWLLLESILMHGDVRYIFLDYELQALLYDHAVSQGVPRSRLDNWFQYPRGKGRSHGIVRHWRHHRGHIHVRFRG